MSGGKWLQRFYYGAALTGAGVGAVTGFLDGVPRAGWANLLTFVWIVIAAFQVRQIAKLERSCGTGRKPDVEVTTGGVQTRVWFSRRP